jgi:hypothetical protein
MEGSTLLIFYSGRQPLLRPSEEFNDSQLAIFQDRHWGPTGLLCDSGLFCSTVLTDKLIRK